MVCVPRVTASLPRPMHLSAHPSTEHSRPQYFPSSSFGRPHFFQTRVAKIDTPDPVSTKKLITLPATCPGRYSRFPTACVPSFAAPLPGHYCDGGACPFPKRRSAAVVGHSGTKWPFWWHVWHSKSAFRHQVDSCCATHCFLCSRSSLISPRSASSRSPIAFKQVGTSVAGQPPCTVGQLLGRLILPPANSRCLCRSPARIAAGGPQPLPGTSCFPAPVD